MRVGIILPTIDGREAMLDRTLAAFDLTRPRGWEFDIDVPAGYPTVGEAWNAGRPHVDGDYLFFAVDDAEPQPGWAEAAVEWSSLPSLPSPRVTRVDGSLEQCGSMGGGLLLPECATGTACRSTPYPFMASPVWDAVGEFMDGHMYCDDDWTWRAELEGVHVYAVREMHFVHHGLRHIPVLARCDADKQQFLDRAAAVGTRGVLH